MHCRGQGKSRNSWELSAAIETRMHMGSDQNGGSSEADLGSMKVGESKDLVTY